MSYRSQLDSKLISQSNDIHPMAISLNDLQEENHTQADEMRHLHQALEASHQSQAELQQQLQQSAQRLETENLKWRQQRQQLTEHLNETKACLEKSQLHLKTLSHTNQSLSSTTKQLQTSYKDLSSQLEKEKLAKEMTCRDMERLREELESEKKTRMATSERVTAYGRYQ
ncbi:rho-associated protein kinase 2-like isoform X2 [Asterias rubens]|uniref:rho-associated protein kinase 2-like isoform X2 n=1 Tax=Asterias rubens TaxID=7604 RepID=UPI001455BC11|nr:rho-associated protein kinase 2-like isoform X2 [Asterias rubens]